jgi:hypothetical protein
MAEQADTIGDWRCCLVVSISFFAISLLEWHGFRCDQRIC